MSVHAPFRPAWAVACCRWPPFKTPSMLQATGALCPCCRVSGLTGRTSAVAAALAAGAHSHGRAACPTPCLVQSLAGTYRGTRNVNLQFRGKRIKLVAAAGPEGTTIDGDAAARAFVFGQGDEGVEVVGARGHAPGFIQRSRLDARPSELACVRCPLVLPP